MAITIEATYENGVLKPLSPLPLKEHEKVQVTVHSETSPLLQAYGIMGFTGSAELADYFALHPDFYFVAEDYQQGGKSEGKQRQKNQVNGDSALSPEPPGILHAVGAAESFHPGDHHAGGGQDGNHRGGEYQPRGVMLGGLKERQGH